MAFVVGEFYLKLLSLLYFSIGASFLITQLGMDNWLDG